MTGMAMINPTIGTRSRRLPSARGPSTGGPDAISADAIENAMGGNQEAQAVLIRGLQDVWFRFCLANLGDMDRARDATQETGLRFLQKLSHFRGESTIQTWSLGIALNVCREERRKRRSESTQDHGLDRLESMEDRGSPLEMIAMAQGIEQLHGLLDRLPSRQREAVLLRYFEELSLEQTARTMDCATGTIKATLNHAIRNLRRWWSA